MLERHRVGQKLLEGTDKLFGIMARGRLPSRLLRAYVAPRFAKWIFSRPAVQHRMIRFVSELFIHYRQSPLSTDAVAGEDVGGLKLTQGPAPGERVPDVPAQAEGVERLYDVLRGPHHTLLLFAGMMGGGGASEALEALARRLEQGYGPDLLRVRVVALQGTPGPSLLVDARGDLHYRFGAGAACLYLVRPDGYVGFRARPIDVQRLEAELATRLGAPS
jgi:hypothetical protein